MIDRYGAHPSRLAVDLSAVAVQSFPACGVAVDDLSAVFGRENASTTADANGPDALDEEGLAGVAQIAW